MHIESYLPVAYSSLIGTCVTVNALHRTTGDLNVSFIYVVKSGELLF